MGSLLVEVKAKMAIYAHEKVRSILDGEYGSVFKGRSMDFDDLREYIPGDDVKDIDWKATARSGSTLIRRYIAIRKHNIMLVVDTGRNMSATSADGKNKKQIAVMLAGVMCTLALKHDDFIGLVYGDRERTKYLPLKTGSTHAEQVLQEINKNIRDDVPQSNIAGQLEYLARNVHRKMIVFVISDETPFDDTLNSVTRRLRAQHEILWLRVSDANLLEANDLTDVAIDDNLMPARIRKDSALVSAYQEAETTRRKTLTQALNHLAISSEYVESEADAVTKVYRLLERHRNAKRA